ncbi:ATP-binding protein [Propionibacterium australiense]|uniref:AAA domain n=1 Tax=Propionibacterium australiense TaxID=119981 RepID=A0A383S9N4_9ACTN|nr:DUF4143 domain-containing protein [Propionibacterium australiense]RLP06343.1 DUF4143 domain-containing protein [Propionibacterium australiense]RLP10733.1 DUF4143 domain-containing protein [Propionibacterium australiense]SYZ34513.1 AAA domain [Propionibacterium australiense]VEH89822.1 Uncharacterised protein [Propionibacterium australiense]
MGDVSYRPRVVDALVDDVLGYSGGLLIEGVRACGKTMTGRQHAASEVALDSGLPQVRAALELDPVLLLEGDTPRLIDEWQLAPVLWNTVRREIDARRRPGQFILTGSSVPAEDAARHSGAHRISRVRLRPMTLFERGLGSGDVSLAALFDGEEPSPVIDSGTSVREALDALVHGGWPGDLDASTAQAQRHLRDYVEDLVTIDVGRLDGEPRRDPIRLRALLRSLARHVATEASFTTIARDVSARTLSAETAVGYVNALKRLFIVEEQPAWAPHLRSRYAVRTSSKLHFVDPALAAAITATSAERLMQDLETAGLWFESLVVQHLQTFAELRGGRVYHYRDKSGKEADAVVEFDDGHWAAFEVKLGQRQIPKAQASLAAFVADIDVDRTSPPVFTAVVTADGPTMRLPDGTLTFPLGALCP